MFVSAASGNRYLVYDVVDYFVCGNVVGFSFVGEADSVAHHVVAYGTHVFYGIT